MLLSQYIEWKRHPVTKEILQLLGQNRVGRLEELAHGHANGGVEQIYLEMGRIQGIEDALHFLAEDVKDVIVDDMEVNNG